MYINTRIPAMMLPPLHRVRTDPRSPSARRSLGYLSGPQNGGAPRLSLSSEQLATNAQSAAYTQAIPGLVKILRAYLADSNYAGAWKFAASVANPTRPIVPGTTRDHLYGPATNFNPIIALLETSAGINLLKLPAFSQAQMSAFYAAARNYWNGDIIGANPYSGTEWGDPGYLAGDAVTNYQTPPDNLYPDLARFSGKHPDPSFFSRWGALIIAVIAAIVTYGASLAATAASAAAEGAAAGAAAGTAEGVAILTADELAAAAAADLTASLPGAIALSVADIAAGSGFAIDTALGTITAAAGSAAIGTSVDTAVAGATLDAITVTSTALPATAVISAGTVATVGAVALTPLAIQSLDQLSASAAQDVSQSTQQPDTSASNTLPALNYPTTIGPSGSGYPTLQQVGQAVGLAKTLTTILPGGGGAGTMPRPATGAAANPLTAALNSITSNPMLLLGLGLVGVLILTSKRKAA